MHITHGSTVTYKVVFERRWLPIACAAARRARTSACAHAVAHHHDGADRDLAARARRSGFADRVVHPAAIGVKLWVRQGLVQDRRVAIGPAIATPRGSSYLGASLGAASPAGFAASFVPPVAPWLAASS